MSVLDGPRHRGHFLSVSPRYNFSASYTQIHNTTVSCLVISDIKRNLRTETGLSETLTQYATLFVLEFLTRTPNLPPRPPSLSLGYNTTENLRKTDKTWKKLGQEPILSLYLPNSGSDEVLG